LRNNRLASVPPEIGGLVGVRYLTLESNLLTSLPPEVGDMRGLENIWFSDNDLTGDLTAPMAGLRANAPSLVSMEVTGRGCPTISDAAVEAWVERFDPDWDAGCR
jgi:Leucine-rich repeat (LRR) protein